MKVNILAMFHPAAALHAPSIWATMLNDWEYMPTKADVSYTIVNPARVYRGLTLALDTENQESGAIGQWSVAYRDKEGKLCVASYSGKQDVQFSDCLVVMHNARWDIRVLKFNGMTVPDNIVDSMVAAYCMGLGRQDVKDANRSGDRMVGGLGLKYLARRHLGFQMNTWLEVKDHPDQMAEYNAKDSVATLLLWEKWKDQLPQHFWDIDMPLLPVLMAMEDRGILVDPDFLHEYANIVDEELKKLDIPINPYSPKQVGEYVYKTLGIEPFKFTASGQPSTDEEVLETIDDPIVKNIMRYRELFKEKKTYLSNYIARMDFGNRIHCEFKQTSTATGRLSSSNPNLQNVTKGTNLRKLFIAPEGKSLVMVDWKQLELLTFAAMTQDPVMLEAIRGGRSIHQETADALGLPYDEGKTINFLMLYGGGAWKISTEFHVPIDKAQEMIDKYYRTYPKIKEYHEQQIAIAHKEGKVSNWFGRVRRLDAMFSEHWRTIKEGEREAINTPIQGTAAEIVKRAMIMLHYCYDAPMLLSVHDELLFEIDKADARAYGLWLKEYIPTITKINNVTFPVSIGIGQNWVEAKENEI